MAFLRIREFLNTQGLDISELSKLTGISEDTIKDYINNSIDINQETSENFRKIARKLNIPVAKLIKPQKKQTGISFKILEKAKNQGIDFTQLCELTKMHPLLLAIYSTQIILKDKWEEEQTQQNIQCIAKELNSTPEELVVIEDPPITQLRMNDFLLEKGLSLDELSLLYNTPRDALDLLNSQPVDLPAFLKLKDDWKMWPRFCCEYLWCCKIGR